MNTLMCHIGFLEFARLDGWPVLLPEQTAARTAGLIVASPFTRVI
jgi:hypothetical protein